MIKMQWRRRHTTSHTGFTLLEVLIALAILATLTVFVAQSIQKALQTKRKIQHRLTHLSQVRDAMRVMQKDLNQAFHYRDINTEIYADYKKKQTTDQNDTGQAQPEMLKIDTTELQQQEEKKLKFATHFIGYDNKFDFVTLNTLRTQKDIKHSDYVEVGYFVQDCKNLQNPKKSSKCLWRRESKWADEDVTKGGTKTVLLENVEEFKCRYYGAGKQDWVTDWKTDKRGDAATKHKFPETVEVSLTTQMEFGGKTWKVSMQRVFSLHFPNNQETKEPDSATTKE